MSDKETSIIGCAMEVHKILGNGFQEVIYQRAFKECGQPTCMVFASLAVEGVEGVEDWPGLRGENREKLSQYLSQFRFGCEI